MLSPVRDENEGMYCAGGGCGRGGGGGDGKTPVTEACPDVTVADGENPRRQKRPFMATITKINKNLK